MELNTSHMLTLKAVPSHQQTFRYIMLKINKKIIS